MNKTSSHSSDWDPIFSVDNFKERDFKDGTNKMIRFDCIYYTSLSILPIGC